jgi:hypothetical protein
MIVDGDQISGLTFRARALAQAHPLSTRATRYRKEMIDAERLDQPLSEFADWAATAFLVGYCIRRVEEAERNAMPTNLPTDRSSDADLDALGRRAAEFSDEVRQGRPAGEELLPVPVVEELLNTVISTEIDKRSEHWKANISAADWAQFEQYVAWWVIHGYALRAAETTTSSRSAS